MNNKLSYAPIAGFQKGVLTLSKILETIRREEKDKKGSQVKPPYRALLLKRRRQEVSYYFQLLPINRKEASLQNNSLSVRNYLRARQNSRYEMAVAGKQLKRQRKLREGMFASSGLANSWGFGGRV